MYMPMYEHVRPDMDRKRKHQQSSPHSSHSHHLSTDQESSLLSTVAGYLSSVNQSNTMPLPLKKKARVIQPNYLEEYMTHTNNTMNRLLPAARVPSDCDVMSNCNHSSASSESCKSVSFGKITIQECPDDGKSVLCQARRPLNASTKQEISLDDYEAARLLVPPSDQLVTATQKEKQLMLRIMILRRGNEIENLRKQVEKMKEAEKKYAEMMLITAKNIIDSRSRLESSPVIQAPQHVCQSGTGATGSQSSVSNLTVEQIVKKVLSDNKNRNKRFSQ